MWIGIRQWLSCLAWNSDSCCAPWTLSSVSSMSNTTRLGTWAKLSQNRSIIAAIMRSRVIRPGLFSSRETVGCEHRSPPVCGSRPTAILKAGSARSASQSLPSG